VTSAFESDSDLDIGAPAHMADQQTQFPYPLNNEAPNQDTPLGASTQSTDQTYAQGTPHSHGVHATEQAAKSRRKAIIRRLGITKASTAGRSRNSGTSGNETPQETVLKRRFSVGSLKLAKRIKGSDVVQYATDSEDGSSS